MKYAIISDIHANLEALSAVLSFLKEEEIEKIFCLGDIVGYFSNPNECIELLRKNNVFSIAGNHDRVAVGLAKPIRFSERGRHAIEWTKRQLTPANREYLRNLPSFHRVDDLFILFHGALHPQPNEFEYLHFEPDLLRSFEKLERDYQPVNLGFFGHTHLSATYKLSGGVLTMTTTRELSLESNAFFLVNPGSVGKSHNYRDESPSLVLYDSMRQSLQFLRTPYDHSTATEKLHSNKLIPSPSLISRFIRKIRYQVNVA